MNWKNVRKRSKNSMTGLSHFPNQELTMNSDDTYDALILAKSHFQLVEAPGYHDHVHTTRMIKSATCGQIPAFFMERFNDTDLS